MVYPVDLKVATDFLMYNELSCLEHYKVETVLDEYELKEGVCFNYALKDYRLGFCSSAFKYLASKYTQIPFKQAKAGDLVVYFHLGYRSKKPGYSNSTHYAILRHGASTVKKSIIESKWGRMGVYLSKIEDVPDDYGNAVTFWRRNNNASKKS